MKYLRVNLKVCEGCGGLWLRNDAAVDVYCRGCAERLAGFPSPRQKHAGGRPRLARVSRCKMAAGSTGGAR